jgi:hypothetical protein
MPIKSQAQRRKFAELLMKGDISEEVYERWNREAGSKVLPERVTPKGRRTRKTTARRKTTATRKTRSSARRVTPKKRARKGR